MLARYFERSEKRKFIPPNKQLLKATIPRERNKQQKVRGIFFVIARLYFSSIIVFILL